MNFCLFYTPREEILEINLDGYNVHILPIKFQLEVEYQTRGLLTYRIKTVKI
jgi:hypothetical protein